jgi:hypothetical protein
MAIRLINTKDFSLTSFVDVRTPEYAILSHTWDHGQEISFSEMMAIFADPHHPGAGKSGYKKIVSTCQHALADGISFCWIDTCCIDKTSSSELSESINSMFHWYRKARVCYSLLSDIECGGTPDRSVLTQSKWFTRGWCLQELIAPTQVLFFDKNWRALGTRTQLAASISAVTGIDVDLLKQERPVQSFPIATRISWAAGRQTTHEEDTAYCLLGILDITMPILYGEGVSAFRRLQIEIIARTNDLSLFAFREPSNPLGENLQNPPMPIFGDVLAKSPKEFAQCGGLVNTGTLSRLDNAFAFTNKGISFAVAELEADIAQGVYSMLLDCRDREDEKSSRKLYLQQVGPNLYVRCNAPAAWSKGMEPQNEHIKALQTVRKTNIYILTNITASILKELASTEDFAIRIRSRNPRLCEAMQVVQRSLSTPYWDHAKMQFLTCGKRPFFGYLKVFPRIALQSVGGKHEPGEDDNHFYLFCGLLSRTADQQPQAWVRLLSVREWRTMENNYGTITDIDCVLAPFDHGTTKSHIDVGVKSRTCVRTVAFLKSHYCQDKRFIEVQIDFIPHPKAG